MGKGQGWHLSSGGANKYCWSTHCPRSAMSPLVLGGWTSLRAGIWEITPHPEPHILFITNFKYFLKLLLKILFSLVVAPINVVRGNVFLSKLIFGKIWPYVDKKSVMTSPALLKFWTDLYCLLSSPDYNHWSITFIWVNILVIRCVTNCCETQTIHPSNRRIKIRKRGI